MDGHSKKAFSSTKKTPLTQDLKLFQSIYSHDLNLIYSRKSSYTYSTSTGSPSPSQGFLSAAHDLCRKYLGEKMYYNEKMYVKLWLLFAAHVDLFRGELDLGDLQSSVPCPSSRGSCGNNSVYVKTLLKTGEIVTPSTIYQYMITHKIGKYLSVFYLAAANYYESIQDISQCSIFINCGIQVNAEPLADLLQFQDAFKKRRSLQNSSSRSIIPENYLTHPKTKRECSFEEIRAIHYWLTVEAQLAEKRKIEEAHVAEGQRKEEENIREFDVPDKLLLTESKIKNRLENIENYSLRARESPLDFSRPFVDPSSGDLPIIKPHPVINPSIPHVVDISTRLPYLSSTTKEYSFIDDEPMPFTLASQNIIEDDEEIEANRIKSEAVEDIMSIAGPREPFCDNTLENIESSVCNINVETVKSDIQNFGSVENQISEPVQSLSSGPMGTMEIERLDKVTFEILGNCIDQDEVSFNIHELRKEEYTIEKAFSVHSPFHSFPLIPKKYDSLSLLISLNDDRILEEIAVIYFSRFLLQHFMENMDYKLHSLSLENFEICMSDEDGLEENLLDLTTPKSLVSYLEKIFYLRFHPSSENGTDKWLKTPETFSSLDKYNLDKSQIIQFFHALLFSSTSSSATLASDHSAALINDFNNLEYYSSYWMVLFQILDSSCSHFNNTSSSLILQTHSLNLLLNISENLIYSQRKSFPSLLLLLKKYEVLLYEK